MSILPHRPEYLSVKELQAKRAELNKAARMSSDLASDIIRETHGGQRQDKFSHDYTEFWEMVGSDVDRLVDPEVVGSKRYEAKEVVPYFAGKMRLVIKEDDKALVKYLRVELKNAQEVIDQIKASPDIDGAKFDRVLDLVNNITHSYIQATPDSVTMARAENPRLRF